MNLYLAAFQRTFLRAFPIIATLAPIGFLFGILAVQHNWSPLAATLLSLLGFSGSGQFVLFSLKDQQVGWWLSLAVILLINMRYIPMSISASRPIKGSWWRRLIAAHYLCDEAFAIEQPQDSSYDKIAIRLWICSFWILATFLGAMSFSYLPPDMLHHIGRLSFAASALLTLLALFRMKDIAKAFPSKGLILTLLAILFSSLFFWLLGPRYFWVPGILTAYLLFHYGLGHYGLRKKDE